jgi:hypothetical protein
MKILIRSYETQADEFHDPNEKRKSVSELSKTTFENKSLKLQKLSGCGLVLTGLQLFCLNFSLILSEFVNHQSESPPAKYSHFRAQ